MAAVKRGRRNPNQVEIVKEKGEKGFVDEKPTSTGVSEVASSSSSESNVARLRERWELASVLNFLHVFKPLIELKMELSAEEIEQGLITPNNVLSQLHIALLKGIPPVNKNLSGPDAWMAILLKKLAPWWPWVAEGEIPLGAGQGEEVSSILMEYGKNLWNKVLLDHITGRHMIVLMKKLRPQKSWLISGDQEMLQQHL